MHRKIIKEAVLSKHVIEDINLLYEECNRRDSTKYIFDQSDEKKDTDINTFLIYEDEKLVSVLNIFAPTDAEAELIALTKPDMRKKGYFTMLFAHAETEIRRRQIKSILFVCDANSRDGNEVVRHLGSSYEYSEFLMRFRSFTDPYYEKRTDVVISVSEPSEKQRVAEINRKAFDLTEIESLKMMDEFFNSPRRKLYSIKFDTIVIGIIGVYEDPERNYIYDFCIDEAYRNRGIGKYVLREIVQRNITGVKPVDLEVRTENKNALQLYEKTGFAIQAEFKYYRKLPV